MEPMLPVHTDKKMVKPKLEGEATAACTRCPVALVESGVGRVEIGQFQGQHASMRYTTYGMSEAGKRRWYLKISDFYSH